MDAYFFLLHLFCFDYCLCSFRVMKLKRYSFNDCVSVCVCVYYMKLVHTIARCAVLMARSSHHSKHNSLWLFCLYHIFLYFARYMKSKSRTNQYYIFICYYYFISLFKQWNMWLFHFRSKWHTIVLQYYLILISL